jgi:hypothetical protein
MHGLFEGMTIYWQPSTKRLQRVSSELCGETEITEFEFTEYFVTV